MRSTLVSCFMFGCLALGSISKAAEIETTDLEKACVESEPGSCQQLQQALKEPSKAAEHSCYGGDMGACYEYGLIREKRRDDFDMFRHRHQTDCTTFEV